MNWLTEPFSNEFMLQALLAGVLAVVTTSLIGTWVVLRGLSFMGDAMAHGVLPGIALAFVWGFDLTVGAVLSAVVMIAGIDYVHRRARLSEDTAIGLLFVGMLAVGVIIMSKAPSFAGSLTGFLFGNILAVGNSDLIVQAVAAGVTALAVAVFYRPFLVLSFNEDKAEVLNLRPRIAHAVMLGLLTLAIVTSFRVVGNLLVFGLLVAPAATASLLVRRVPTMMITAVVIGIATVAGGLLLTWHADTAAGASIAGTSVALFFVVLIARQITEAVRR
ncbi:MAG: metal ABC transporter permease [Acidimicrobiia bacterium]|jgi:manganese/iron transport system permease protein|nr:metal ABC transporter permease [Acidimicrobiia bacterium]